MILNGYSISLALLAFAASPEKKVPLQNTALPLLAFACLQENVGKHPWMFKIENSDQVKRFWVNITGQPVTLFIENPVKSMLYASNDTSETYFVEASGDFEKKSVVADISLHVSNKGKSTADIILKYEGKTYAAEGCFPAPPAPPAFKHEWYPSEGPSQ